MMDRVENDPAGREDQRPLIDDAFRQIKGLNPSTASTVARHVLEDAGYRRPLPVDGIPGYDILGEIHGGGQGVVYRAMQRSTGRIVALKVMREGPLASRSERLRFEREVQVLAQLRHPNIVAIHDSDSIEGRFFYVMDYIDGLPLDQFVFGSRRSMRQVIELFVDICDAVNAAHLRGVIHRDLKPSNVRVDERGHPYVLDFGLSKVVSEHDEDASSMTVTGQFVGTAPWASPEQAAGEVSTIDVRTDVYSLGVLLYQMLTGRFPYDVTGSPGEVLERIRHLDPMPLRSLRRDIPADVETIILKALQKDPARRYQSAGELGRDLQRYLAGEPIEARRDSLRYVLAKQFARHKLAVGVAGAFAALVFVGLGVSLVLWQQAVLARDAEREQAEVARRNAERAAVEARRASVVAGFLEQMLTSANPMRGEGREAKVVDAIDAARERIERGELSGQPEHEATLRRVLGEAYAGLGELGAASEQLRKGAETFARVLGRENEQTIRCVNSLGAVLRVNGGEAEAESLLRENLETARRALGAGHLITGQAAAELASVLRDGGRLEESEALMLEALGIFRKELAAEDADLASLINNLAMLRDNQGRYEEAEELYRESLELNRRAVGERHAATATIMSNLAGVLVARDKMQEAEGLYLKALDILREVHGRDHPSITTALTNLGVLYNRLQRFDEAEPLLREAIEQNRRRHGEQSVAVATGLNNLAMLLYGKGDLDGAAASFEEALKIFAGAHGEDHPTVISVMNNVATIRMARGDFAGARPMLEKLVQLQLRRVGPEHPSVAQLEYNLAHALDQTGEKEAAEALFRTALAKRRAALGADHQDVAGTLNALGDLLRRMKRYDEAREVLNEALRMREAKLGRQHALVADTINNLACVRSDEGDAAGAEPLFAEAAEIAEQTLPAGHWRVAAYRMQRASCLGKLGAFEAGEPEMLAACAAMEKALGAEHPHTQRAFRYAAEFYERWERPAEAAAWRARLSGEAAEAGEAGGDETQAQRAP